MDPGAEVFCPCKQPPNEESDMLVPPPARIPGRSVREWLQLADAYSLWAFNAPRMTHR